MTQTKQRLLVWSVAILVAAFTGLAAYHFKNRSRSEHDAALVQELQAAALPDTEQPLLRPGAWPSWRGPLRNGICRETGLLASWPDKGPKVLWQAPIGTGYSSMVAADGRLITMMRHDDEEQVVCLDAVTGEQRWAYGYRVQYGNEYGSGPRSTPAIDGERVYAVGVTGMLTCLDIQNGHKIWERDLLREFSARNLSWGVSFSPLVEGNLVYAMPGGPNGKALAALDKRDGRTVWQSENDSAGYSSPILATMAGTRQVLFFTGMALVSVNPDTGAAYWRYSWPTQHDCNVATPIVRGDYVFIASNYGMGCTLLKIGKEGAAFKAERVYFTNDFCDHHSGSVLWGESIYGFNDAALTCLDFRTGAVSWKKSGFGKGTLLIADGRLIILGENGKLALAEASPESYREKSQFKFSGPRCWTSPIVAEGRLYVRNEEKLVCYDLKNP